MNILEINTEKNWRGGERQTLYTVEGLSAKGNTVSLLCLRNSALAKKAALAGTHLVEVDSQAGITTHLLFNSGNYDVIHVQNSKALIWALHLKWLHRKPVVYTRRVDFVPHGVFTIWKYNLADKITAVSTAVKTIMEKQGVKNVDVIPDVAKEKTLNRKNAELAISQNSWAGKKIIATTAAFVPHKDPHTMVLAIAELKKMRNDFVFLHFGNGELMQEIKEEVKKLGLEKEYIFMGFREDVEDFFSVMDVFVMSSQEEGLGSSVLDAFLYNVPVAATDAGGLKETVEGCGLLSPVKDFKALATAIDQLLNDKALRISLTEKSKQRVVENYGIEKNTVAYLNIFSKFI